MCRGASSSSSASPFGGLGLTAPGPRLLSLNQCLARSVRGLGLVRSIRWWCDAQCECENRCLKTLMRSDASVSAWVCARGASSGSGLFGGAFVLQYCRILQKMRRAHDSVACELWTWQSAGGSSSSTASPFGAGWMLSNQRLDAAIRFPRFSACRRLFRFQRLGICSRLGT